MNSHFLCYVIFILSILIGSNTAPEKIDADFQRPLKISIYFTSMCPGSRYFITHHLYPNYEALRQRVRLEWVLYQKRMDYAPSKFHCLHGPEECHYNRYIVCALDQRRNQDQDVYMLNCLMYNYDFKFCLTQFGYMWTEYKKCISKRGYSILANHTNKIDDTRMRRLRYLPAVIYNDNDRENLDYRSLRKFRETVCSKLVAPLPSICYN